MTMIFFFKYFCICIIYICMHVADAFICIKIEATSILWLNSWSTVMLLKNLS